MRGENVLGVGGQLSDPSPVAPEGAAELQGLRHRTSARIEDQDQSGIHSRPLASRRSEGSRRIGIDAGTRQVRKTGLNQRFKGCTLGRCERGNVKIFIPDG